ncbi:uncharacterized protein LOC113361772 [Papaver somniferum]|uniref:uncharacterized protein LOC113361772 n=1 Tax=Papaver somniferum TaxID=3469 RepID=UPI000E701C8C|nr:uncharacterized protein LOC113361772 [Papaver somniferum]XP_026460694.1 uncharacterized protein LOC113361772 [Papaver somniferum]XP_026460695.1 uncharacterized protein LOC113361772 [Papaver somniferum]
MPSTTKLRPASVNNGRRTNEFVTDESFVNSGSAKEVVTDAVDERLDGQRAKEIVTDAVDEKLNAVALSKQRSVTTKPCSAFRENEIVTDPVDERLGSVADMLDAGRCNRDEDAGILDADGDSDVLIVEDQTLPTDSNEGAGTLDVDGNSDYKNVEEQSLPINSDKVAASSRKRQHNEVQRKVTDPHSGSNNTNFNSQGSTSKPSSTRIPIIFDKYGRPCDFESEEFAMDIGRMVRAHCRPAFKSWKKVPFSVKDDIWKDVVARYILSGIHKPNVFSKANKAWRTWSISCE